MKKLILLLVVAIAALAPDTAQAQKIKSSSTTIFREEAPPKEPVKKWWAAKLGFGIASDEGVLASYNLSLSYNRAFGYSDWYWGAQIGTSTFNESHEYEDPTCQPTIYLGPKAGYTKRISRNAILDAHAAVNFEYIFSDDTLFCISPELGIGVWYKRFLIELQYNYGIELAWGDYSNSRLLLNIGIRF
ncbi:MAG: hypothetical protein K2F77_01435 [Muribaculaceae bacterium]|nr:hypothetical protein [Muribaculaceae bacterium]